MGMRSRCFSNVYVSRSDFAQFDPIRQPEWVTGIADWAKLRVETV